MSSYVDAETTYIYFSRHYVGYLNNSNKAVGGKPGAQKTIKQLLSTSDTSNATLRNNAEGYYDHNLYFGLISPKGGGTPTEASTVTIDHDFGSFENFERASGKAGVKRFGSG